MCSIYLFPTRLREGLLSVLGNEADSSVRTAIALLVGLVARHEPWPVLVQTVHTLITAEDLPQKQVGSKQLMGGH